jgi:hypothetical protein
MKKATLWSLAFAATLSAGIALAGGVAPPPNEVPEPGTLALLAGGIVAVVAVRLMKRK